MKNLKEVYKEIIELDNNNKTHSALDLLYDRIFDICDCCNTPGFDELTSEVDMLLDEIDVKLPSIEILLGLLTTTLWFKNNLKNRVDFYNRVLSELIDRKGEKYTERLICGLE